jgi:hypothetical protein
MPFDKVENGLRQQLPIICDREQNLKEPSPAQIAESTNTNSLLHDRTGTARERAHHYTYTTFRTKGKGQGST